MSIEIKLPDIGLDKVEITEIMVKIGDTVQVEQALITVEGDKASIEVPSPQAGIVKEITVVVGDKIETGALIMIFEEESAGHLVHSITAGKKVIEAQAIDVYKEVKLPDICSDEVEVTAVKVMVGDQVAIKQIIITITADKTSLEVPAMFAGIVKEIFIKPGDKVKSGSLIMVFTAEGVGVSSRVSTNSTAVLEALDKEEDKPAFSTKTETYKIASITQNAVYAHATPAIRRLAREFGVSLAKVKGSGRKSRILREDIQTYIKDVLQNVDPTPGDGILYVKPCQKVDFRKFGEIEEIEVGRIQKISGANLSRNWIMIPHVTHFDKCDITDLEAFRKEQNKDAEKCNLDVKFTPLAFIMKVVAVALKQMPRFNSSLSEDGEKLTLKKYINIGVAVDTVNGLVVPVFKDINKKGLNELSRELIATAKKARAGKLSSIEMQGGCFTISSLGSIGTTHFSPIINAPEVAILGVSKTTMEPIWNGNEFIPRMMMPISLSFDHRVIDGADGARFISIINKMLSDIRHLVM